VSDDRDSAWANLFPAPESQGPWRVRRDPESFCDWAVYRDDEVGVYGDSYREFEARAICDALNRHNPEGLD
jgi:hypothetical protein